MTGTHFIRRGATALLILAASFFGSKAFAQKTYEAKIRQAVYSQSSFDRKPLGILHYSDIHGDQEASDRILGYISTYSPYIDAVVNNGDAIHFYADATAEYPHDARWWRSTGLAEKSLFVLGNHDGAMKSNEKGYLQGSADWDFKGQDWDFDTYFKDYINSVGYTMPEGYDDPKSPYYKSCFWLKDFPEAKIRIIGLDCMHFNDGLRYLTSQQEEWLAARLDDTLDPSSSVHDYSVIIVCHYPIDDFDGDNAAWDEASHKFVYNHNPAGGRVMNARTGDVTAFNTYSVTSFSAQKRFALRKKVPAPSKKYGFSVTNENPLGDIVQSWVDKGGKFVVWLSGHCHKDMMFYSAKYPDLLCVAVDQAGALRGSDCADRKEGTEERVCANFYGVDTENGLFKIVRLGLDMDRYMVRKDILCYDYINRVVISE